MSMKAVLCAIIVLVALLSSINSITVNPGKNITEGNCGGQLEYFLCNCTSSNDTIDIRLSPGRYNLTHQHSCLLQNKTTIKLIGSSSDDTIIECQEPFNIVFKRVRDVIISNITMVNCGNLVNDLINQTIYSITNSGAHLGSGFRFAIMFYQVKDVTITDVTMHHTLGYGIVAFNAIGNITISKFNVKNTTFENDPYCNSYVYNGATADFICSGSGIFMIYYDNENETNTILTIDQSNFVANRNFLPYRQFNILNDAINTGFYRTSIPLQGAAGIAIFYLQNLYDVNATITNSLFHNNNGTLSAGIAIGSLATIRGITVIKNCSFDDNNRVNKSQDITSISSIGGISYYYLTLHNIPAGLVDITLVEIVKVVQCNFTKLGGTLGAAFHIEKISTNSQSLSFRIEQCNFIANEANVGSAVYAVDHRFDATLSNGLIIHLVNVNAKDNSLLPGSTVEHGSDDSITGVFHSETCYFKLDCNRGCNFSNNIPSVFYGHSTYLAISGKAIFFSNTARNGGGLNLINTVAFIRQNSELCFSKNHAVTHGGAIYTSFSNTNIPTQDICPIQFIGLSDDTIFSLDNIHQINVNVTFEDNTAISKSTVQSIYANVFYICTWYPNTLTQINLGKGAQVINGTRLSVYRKMFNFMPVNTADKHLSILAYLPCPCDENNTYDAHYCMTTDVNNTLKLGTTVIVGRSFTISLITLDVVGSIGYSSNLYSEVSSNTTNNVLTLPKEQFSRSFSIINNSCTPINFTIYSLKSVIPRDGTLHLSLSPNSGHHLHFSFEECPIGFSLQNVSGLFACTCGKFFNKSPIVEDLRCDMVSGKIERIDVQSWLSVINNRVEYTKLCLPEYCNNIVSKFRPTDLNVLCNHRHTGRACSMCVDGLGKTFGSKVCRKCSNIWLVTILLYAILGIILVLIIHLLKLTVTMGTINGLIFFCNVMSINESLFFDPSEFSFIRLFISVINLDLGFEMCFYREMSEIAKTGLQFVFPLYLWLLMFIIIMVGKHYVRTRKSTYSAVPVLATLILLSYSKILRTTISVFSSVTVHYSTNDSNFSRSQQFIAWQPDPNIIYLEGTHIVLFLVALVFTVVFILPLAFALTFPKVVLRSKKLSYFFPLLDCIYAPYNNQYRYWFGVRIIVLIYLSGMESVLFSYQDALLLSGVVAILLFAFVQAYIHPYKSTINNTLDLMFMGIFIILATVILYLYPNTSGHQECVAVNILGGVAFLLFCVIVIFHLYDTVTHLTWYSKLIDGLKIKFNTKNAKSDLNPLRSMVIKYVHHKSDNNKNARNSSFAHLQETLLEEQFN